MSPCQPASARRLHLIAAAIAAAFLPAAAQAADFFWSTGDFVTGVTAPEPLLFGDTLFIQAGGAKRFVGSTFTNQGLVRWQSDSLQGGNSASVMNSGTWQSESDTNTMIWGFGGRPTFTNSGTYAKTAGTTTNVGSWAFVNAGGLIDAQVGTIVFNGDANTFNAGSRFSGAGQVAITGGSTFNGSFTADNLVFAGGANNGTGAILSGGVASAGGNAGWTGGDFSGSWTIAAGSTMTASGAAGKRQVGSAIDNKGKFVWDTMATLQGGNSSTFTNNGQTEVRQSATFEWNFGGQAAFVNNAGASVLATNNATLTFGNLVLTGNGGSFVADAGSAIVFNGGSNRFNDGTQFTGDIRAQGTSTYVGNISTSGLRWTGGTQFGGDGTPGSQAVLAGTVSWEDGDVQRNFVIGAASTMTTSGAASKRQVGSAIDNKGKFIWDTTATLQGGNSSSFVNNGSFDMRTDADLTWNFGGQASLTNIGVFVKSAGIGTTSLSGLALSNTGTMDVQSGAIELPTNFVNAGTMMGTGAFALSGTLTNNGHVAPGASPGTLTISGSFAQSALGTLDTELENLSSVDLLLIDGNASLAGTLALSCFASCDFAVGDEVVILDATGNLSGSFGSVTLAGFGSGAFDVVYDLAADRVLLRITETVTPAIPEPGTIALMLAGLGMVVAAARRRRG